MLLSKQARNQLDKEKREATRRRVAKHQLLKKRERRKGDWYMYIVEYDGNRFPGGVVAVGCEVYQVSVMERAG